MGGDPGHSAWSECLVGGKGTEAEAAAHARKPTTNAISDIQGPSPKVTGSSSTIRDRVHSTEKGDSSHSKAGYMSQGLLKYKVLSRTFCVCSHEPRGKGMAGARPAVTGTCPRPHAR